MTTVRFERYTELLLRFVAPSDCFGDSNRYRFDGKVLYWHDSQGFDNPVIVPDSISYTDIFQVELKRLIDPDYVAALQQLFGATLFGVLMSALSVPYGEEQTVEVADQDLAELFARCKAKSLFDYASS
jgi:hypothetical protein